MAKIQEILQTEKERDDATKSIIHLFQEGSFYRAYEWSAWLCHRYITQFKPTHRKFKNIEETVLFVGFPVTSLTRHVPESSTVNSVNEKQIDISLDESIIPEDMTVEIMQTDYESWKSSIPIMEPKQKNTESDVKERMFAYTKDQVSISPLNLTSIMQRILSFPIENKTPMQCMAFLADTKVQLASII